MFFFQVKKIPNFTRASTRPDLGRLRTNGLKTKQNNYVISLKGGIIQIALIV